VLSYIKQATERYQKNQ